MKQQSAILMLLIPLNLFAGIMMASDEMELSSISSGRSRNPGSEYSGVISRFISAVLKGSQPVIYGDGEQTRDFMFVKDVVRACEIGAESKTRVYNVARGESTSLNQLVRMLGETIGREVRARYVQARARDIRHSRADARTIK